MRKQVSLYIHGTVTLCVVCGVCVCVLCVWWACGVVCVWCAVCVVWSVCVWRTVLYCRVQLMPSSPSIFRSAVTSYFVWMIFCILDDLDTSATRAIPEYFSFGATLGRLFPPAVTSSTLTPPPSAPRPSAKNGVRR